MLRSESKTCTKCGQSKPATNDFFYASRYGLRADCKSCVIATSSKTYEADKPKKIAAATAYNKLHRAESREYVRRWTKANPERAAASQRAWVLANPEKARQHGRDWCRRNPEKVAAKDARRRAREIDADGTHTAADIKEQFVKQDGKCFYCQVALTSYHVDHFIPLAKGGTNWPSNLVCACPSCNLQKGCTMPHDFQKAAA